MLELLKALTLTFHDRHYLPILLKKHLIGIHFDNLPELSKEDLKERLKLIEEVSTTIKTTTVYLLYYYEILTRYLKELTYTQLCLQKYVIVFFLGIS